MDYLDDIDIEEFREIPTYKRMCICILRNDHTCKYMGFALNKEETLMRNNAMKNISIFYEYLIWEYRGYYSEFMKLDGWVNTSCVFDFFWSDYYRKAPDMFRSFSSCAIVTQIRTYRCKPAQNMKRTSPDR